MTTIVAERAASITPSGIKLDIDRSIYLDPLDNDCPDDAVVITTRRAISRVALVAAETAGRFQRDAVPHDPMTWMLAPLALFSGASAIEACLDRDACMRGILIHGLSLGLDADPMTIDALTSDDDAFDTRADWDIPTELEGCGSNVLRFRGDEGDGSRLFTATIVASDGCETVQAFHASFTAAKSDVAGRLRCRIGAASSDARIVEGFDPTDPVVAALVSQVLCDMLSIIAAEPTSPIAAGLDLNIEQRFYG